MKKGLLLLLALMNFGHLYADEYIPLVREGVKWIYAYSSGDSDFFERFSVEFNGNAEVNGIMYAKCWRQFLDENMMPTMETELMGYAREHNRKVYAILPSHDGNTHTDAGLAGENTDEWLVFDFNDVQGFYAQMPQYMFYTTSGPIYKGFECTEAFTMEMGEKSCTAYTILEPSFSGTLVEGYGIFGNMHDYLLDPYFKSSDVWSLSEVMTYGLYSIIEDGEEVYHNAEYDSMMDFSAVTDVDAAAPVQYDRAYYDMQGRRIAEPTQPGIYIHDGKKVIIH